MLDVGKGSRRLCCFRKSSFLKVEPACRNLYSLCVLQVSLLVVMEIGLFPLICGWWLDICSLVSRKLC